MYKDLHKVRDAIYTPRKYEEASQSSNAQVKVPILKSVEVISVKDESYYENETLRNINKYYFLPILDETIPYREVL